MCVCVFSFSFKFITLRLKSIVGMVLIKTIKHEMSCGLTHCIARRTLHMLRRMCSKLETSLYVYHCSIVFFKFAVS